MIILGGDDMKCKKIESECGNSSLQLYFVELPSRKLAVIEEVYTKPKYRNRGLATVLIRQAIRVARDWGADCIELTVRKDSPHIKGFYEDFGFKDRKQVAMRLTINKVRWNPGG